MPALFPRPRSEPAPGAVHVPGWLDIDAQRRLLRACEDWAAPPAGLRTTRLPSGGIMSVRTVCLGWHWYPYGYARTIGDDGTPVKPFPSWLADLGRRAVTEAYQDEAAGNRYQPDVALVNHYDDTAKMGLHQDKDERSRAPVVSLSLGNTCVFRFGNIEHRNRPWTDIELASGDLFVFGGPSRLAYHGVPRTLLDTADPALGNTSGRWNITLRESGLPIE
jgi:alkylated DNA repair protein (DNA oxidative demethylase)